MDRELRGWAWRVAVASVALACGCDVYDSNLSSGVRADASASSDAAISDPGEDARCDRSAAQRRDGCRPGCGDRCNGRDDDCDGAADEASADESCEASEATAICRQGRCLLTGCQNDYRDCDQLASNGCEVAPRDPKNCGACGHVCEIANGEAECREGRCVLVACNAGYADCDGDGRSCESSLDSTAACGACGNVCPVRANATALCSEGACAAARCASGYGDCNGDREDGCEQALDALEHCGGCGVRCDKATCEGGVCSAADCSLTPGSADCDGDELSCEIDLRSDPRNCGACGTACELSSDTAHASPECDDGTCRTRCDPGWGDCDGDAVNGCERSLDSLSNCGGCGQTCTISNAGETCADTRCRVASCNAGFADCDRDGASCETRLDTTDDCGSCGTRCRLPNAQQTCAGTQTERSCVITGCFANYADCDGDAANGCERDLRPAGAGGGGPCLPESNCRRVTREGHEYFLCPNQQTWQNARDLCRAQRGGDLAVVSSSAEAAFVSSLLRARTWIGHTDLNREGLWVWSRTGVPFWRGEIRGNPINAVFSRWALGEPNGSGDCGAIHQTGTFDDHSCTATEPYLCEVAADACPDDPIKWDPGQCGCGRQDVDRTGDGLADCAG